MTDMNTLDSPGEFDALPKLRPGEPYFCLLGRDACAPDAILAWADARRRRILAQFEEGKLSPVERAEELEQATQAEQIAWGMKAYKAGQPNDPKPDGPSEADRYSGYVTPPEQRRKDTLLRQRIEAASAVNNAVAELADLLNILPEGSRAERGIRKAVSTNILKLKSLSSILKPARPGIDA